MTTFEYTNYFTDKQQFNIDFVEYVKNNNKTIPIECILNNFSHFLYKLSFSHGKKGIIYCLYNEMFDRYGENVYKIGETACIESRINAYTSCYATPPIVVYASPVFANSSLAEQLLFHFLSEFRIFSDREFFKCDFDVITPFINNISDMFTNKQEIFVLDKRVTKFKYKLMSIINGHNITRSPKIRSPKIHIQKKKKSLLVSSLEGISNATELNITDTHSISFLLHHKFNVLKSLFSTYVNRGTLIKNTDKFSQILHFKFLTNNLSNNILEFLFHPLVAVFQPTVYSQKNVILDLLTRFSFDFTKKYITLSKESMNSIITNCINNNPVFIDSQMYAQIFKNKKKKYKICDDKCSHVIFVNLVNSIFKNFGFHVSRYRKSVNKKKKIIKVTSYTLECLFF